MISISLCMIVKNEEKTIEKCINSAKDFADEIVIVDTGSTDRTKEIVAKYTDKVFDFEWIDDFSAARNFAFEQASMDYIMWLDADDVILPQDVEKLIGLKRNMPQKIDIVMMKYNTGFDMNGNVTFSYFRERLVKRSRAFKWREPVHEYLELGGNIINSDICVTHTKVHKTNDKRNLNIYENMLAAGKNISVRGRYYYGRELKECGRYDDAARQFNLFLDSEAGWVEDKITACGELAKCRMAEGNKREGLSALLRSFEYDVPRAEICCQLGYYFKELEKYGMAAYWFEAALNLTKPEGNWGFRLEDCWGYIPCIECAVCYDKLGDYEKAERYNDRAMSYKPESPAVLYNKKYFSERKEHKFA